MAINPRENSTPDYTMGYQDETMNRYRRRSAEKEAAYLLPHLKPGMRVLDIGCGPGSISVGVLLGVGTGVGV